MGGMLCGKLRGLRRKPVKFEWEFPGGFLQIDLNLGVSLLGKEAS